MVQSSWLSWGAATSEEDPNPAPSAASQSSLPSVAQEDESRRPSLTPDAQPGTGRIQVEADGDPHPDGDQFEPPVQDFSDEIEPWPIDCTSGTHCLPNQLTAEELQALQQFRLQWRDVCCGIAPQVEDSSGNGLANTDDGGPEESVGDATFGADETNMSFSDASKYVLGRSLDVQQAVAKAVRRTAFFQNTSFATGERQHKEVDTFLNDYGVYSSGIDKQGRPVFWTDLKRAYSANMDDIAILTSATEMMTQAIINPNFADGLKACREGMCFVYDARFMSITDFRMDIARAMYTWSRTIPTRVARIIFVASMTLRWMFRPLVNMFLGKYRDKMHFVALEEVEEFVDVTYWPTHLGGRQRPGFAEWIRARCDIHENNWPEEEARDDDGGIVEKKPFVSSRSFAKPQPSLETVTSTQQADDETPTDKHTSEEPSRTVSDGGREPVSNNTSKTDDGNDEKEGGGGDDDELYSCNSDNNVQN